MSTTTNTTNTTSAPSFWALLGNRIAAANTIAAKNGGKSWNKGEVVRVYFGDNFIFIDGAGVQNLSRIDSRRHDAIKKYADFCSANNPKVRVGALAETKPNPAAPVAAPTACYRPDPATTYMGQASMDDEDSIF